MSTTPDKLVERYLKHLEVELDDLPRDRRREIVDEIGGHITEARGGVEHETEAHVRNIREGLGDPADIAEDARERFDVRDVLISILLIAVVVAPIITTAYLTYRLRRRTAAATA